MSERRGLKRYPAELRVWCESDDLTIMLQTSNVSRGGMFLKTSTPPPPEQELRLTIESLQLVARARVRWCRKESGTARSGMGLELVAIEEGRERYEGFVEQCSARSGEHGLNLPALPKDDD